VDDGSVWNLALVAPVIDRLRQLEPFHGNLKPSFLVELAYRLFRLPAGFSACLRNLSASSSDISSHLSMRCYEDRRV
jgi:hypothetical protein